MSHTWLTMGKRVESPSATFRAGNYVFSCSQALQLYQLHRNGSTIWQLKENYHPNATLKQIIVAIHVGIMGDIPLEQLTRHIFDPNLVCLEIWRIGHTSQNNE